jgi:CRISPR-associated protein (TIGR03986 family)
MFGYIDQLCAADQKKLSLKGRISISHAEALNNPQALSVERPILGTPKPTYFANYLEQPNNLSKPEVYYKTYMQDKSNDQCRVRGWKRYPTRKAELAKAPSAGQEFKRVRTPLVPLSPGAKFTFTARFHNLRIVELGALVWALTWGGDEKLRHSIGMAKPFGYGQALIALNCDKSELKDIKGNPFNKDTEKVLSDAMIEFERVMEEFAKNCGLVERGWKGSSQIVQLRAMADPTCDKLVARIENGTVITCCQNDKLRHMALKNAQGKNEFVEARKWDQRVHNKFRLERHVDENDPEVRHRYGK